jgi:hypothetical protein
MTEYVSKLDTIQPTGKTLFIIFVDAPFTVRLPRLFTNKADVIVPIPKFVSSRVVLACEPRKSTGHQQVR